MAYPYICLECKAGAHARCEEARKVPANAAGELVFGGGVCVCPHDRVYASPSEVWSAKKENPDV